MRKAPIAEEIQYSEGVLSDENLFDTLFSSELLQQLFNERFLETAGKGLDRVNGRQFFDRSAEQFQLASKKCKSGKYFFTPYLELLRIKGRGKEPRVISIPTIRDRVILSQLNRFLAAIYPECVPKNTASTYIREIATNLAGSASGDVWVCSTDIKVFYDSIQRDRLLKILNDRIKSKSAMKLIERSLITPTVSKNSQRSAREGFKTEKGVPQGLSISNILASIYMQNVDKLMNEFVGVSYHRYVDDVLIIGSSERVMKAYKSLLGRLKRRGLCLHSLSSPKTQMHSSRMQFSYLGYVFSDGKITVRSSTVEAFIQSIAAQFSDFKHNKKRKLTKFKYLTEDRLKEIFILELNDRLTGAIRDKRRYGWIAYFNQINDLTLLHHLDGVIAGLFLRLEEFNCRPPDNLKKIRRAYWEMKFNVNGGYVRDYDKIITVEEKIRFLGDRGRIDPNEQLSDGQINQRYLRYVLRNLASMQVDEGINYG